jgi:beta-lactamase class A
MRLILRVSSLLLILAAAYLTYQEYLVFQQARQIFPHGSRIADVPVGGLTRQEAVQQILEVYNLPVEIHYAGAAIQLTPETAGFEIDLDSMLPPENAGEETFWQEFRQHLLGKSIPPFTSPLQASYTPDKIRAFLANEVAPRYDRPAQAAAPIPGTITYSSAEDGTSFLIDEAVTPIGEAFTSLESRTVDLTLLPVEPDYPSIQNLQVTLQHILKAEGYDGLAGIYLYDLNRSSSIHFAYRQGSLIPVEPDIAFTASSIIKIPIMISVYRRIQESPGETVTHMLGEMIRESSNDAADWLMRNVLDEVRGPLIVSEDLQALGFQNTFLGGYFALGSPLLQRFDTPANSQPGALTDPDPYSQTTPSDIGEILQAVYACAQDGAGPLLEVFSGEITQAECQEMVQYLKEDRIPYLLSAGIPEGTPIAHKHGYGSTGGIINTIGDAGLVFSPGGDYVLAVFLDHPEQLVWDPSNLLVCRLSEAVYAYFNF